MIKKFINNFLIYINLNWLHIKKIFQIFLIFLVIFLILFFLTKLEFINILILIKIKYYSYNFISFLFKNIRFLNKKYSVFLFFYNYFFNNNTNHINKDINIKKTFNKIKNKIKEDVTEEFYNYKVTEYTNDAIKNSIIKKILEESTFVVNDLVLNTQTKIRFNRAILQLLEIINDLEPSVDLSKINNQKRATNIKLNRLKNSIPNYLFEIVKEELNYYFLNEQEICKQFDNLMTFENIFKSIDKYIDKQLNKQLNKQSNEQSIKSVSISVNNKFNIKPEEFDKKIDEIFKEHIIEKPIIKKENYFNKTTFKSLTIEEHYKYKKLIENLLKSKKK